MSISWAQAQETPELLTLRAAAVIEQADAVVYDNLVSPHVLELIKPEAELIYAGKQERPAHLCPGPAESASSQSGATEFAHCRLKGGDPYTFGRGGEEAEVLHANGISSRLSTVSPQRPGWRVTPGFP